MREDLILAEVNRFFADRVFGPQRRALFLAGIDTADDTADRERQAQRQRLQRKLADITRKQDNLLRQAEDADPRDPFTQGLRQRYNDMETERQAIAVTLSDLDHNENEQPDRPRAAHADILDALPHLAINFHRAPRDLLDRLFTLTQLTIQVHYATNQATLKVTLPPEYLPDIATLGAATGETGQQPAGQEQCASDACPR